MIFGNTNILLFSGRHYENLAAILKKMEAILDFKWFILFIVKWHS